MREYNKTRDPFEAAKARGDLTAAIEYGRQALDLAEQINGWSTQGVALTKRMMWSGLETASLDAAIELESHTQLYVRLTTQNFEEATRARKEGRKPDFKD